MASMAESMSVCASKMQGASTLSSLRAMRGAHSVMDVSRAVTRVAPSGCRMVVQASGTQKGGVNPVKSGTNKRGTLPTGGTRYVGGKKVNSLRIVGHSLAIALLRSFSALPSNGLARA